MLEEMRGWIHLFRLLAETPAFQCSPAAVTWKECVKWGSSWWFSTYEIQVALWTGLDLFADCKGCPWLLADMLLKLEGGKEKRETTKLKATFKNWNGNIPPMTFEKSTKLRWERENDLIKIWVFVKEDLWKREQVARLFELLVISEIVLPGTEGMRKIEKWEKMLRHS